MQAQLNKLILATVLSLVTAQVLADSPAFPTPRVIVSERADTYFAQVPDFSAPEIAMPRYVAWLKALPGKPVFVGYPAGFDFLFVYWYLIRFAGESPFSFSALDIKSYAMAMLKKDYRKSAKHYMPKAWFDPLPHTHVALDDAIEQGALFCNMLRENLARD